MKKKILNFILAVLCIVPGVFVFNGCSIMDSDSDIELKVKDGYIQYYDGENWNNLIAVKDLEGEDGIGIDGREVEFQKTDTHLQWRYKTTDNSEQWENLVALSELKGQDGKETEFRKTTTHIQWRYYDANQGDEENWEDLVALIDLKGDKTEITIEDDGFWYIDGKKTEYKAKGEDGKDTSYSTYTITYDYGKAGDLFESNESTTTIKSTEWLTSLPEIKEEYNDSFLGWFVQGSDKKVELYDFIGGNITLEARFNIKTLGLSGLYQKGKYVMTWADIIEEYPSSLYTNTTNNLVGGCFANFAGEIVIDNSITLINAEAFGACKKLTKIIIPNSVTKIGMRAFAYATALTEIEIPDSVNSINYLAFQGCTNLTTVKLPSTLQSIKMGTFSGCVNLTEIELPNTIATLEDTIFYNCNKIKSITLPENLQQIEAKTFTGMHGLETINYNCISLNDITDSGADEDVFAGVGYNVDTVTINIGSKVEKIPACLFDLKYTFEYADEYDGYDTKFVINFKSAVKCTTIGEYAFYNLKTIETVILTNSLTTIGEYAFSNWNSLTDIYFYGTQEEWSSAFATYTDTTGNFATATKHYYSATKPTEAGNYWHFAADGVTPIAW